MEIFLPERDRKEKVRKERRMLNHSPWRGRALIPRQWHVLTDVNSCMWYCSPKMRQIDADHTQKEKEEGTGERLRAAKEEEE